MALLVTVSRSNWNLEMLEHYPSLCGIFTGLQQSTFLHLEWESFFFTLFALDV